ncbi:MAG: S4 domain-containing protein, partial [Rhizomicrobium sp.]
MKLPPKGGFAPEIRAIPASELDDGEERIAKRMARAGVCSRRDAEKLIAEGRVTLNGEKVTTPATKVDAYSLITVNGKTLADAEPTRLWR